MQNNTTNYVKMSLLSFILKHLIIAGYINHLFPQGILQFSRNQNTAQSLSNFSQKMK